MGVVSSVQCPSFRIKRELHTHTHIIRGNRPHEAALARASEKRARSQEHRKNKRNRAKEETFAAVDTAVKAITAAGS